LADLGDPKTALHHYLKATREDLIWKLDGLSEREARLPRTPTGNNLLGVRVAVFADQTIDLLSLDAPGRVPWWRPDSPDVTLQRIIVHVICDLARHAGHADIMREQHDGAIGWQRDDTNIPHDHDWPAYVAKLTKIADRFE